MKVQCEKIINRETAEVSDRDSWLTVGKIYDVLSVAMNENGATEYRLVADDGYTPALFRANQFKIVCPTLPSNWIAHSESDSYFELTPKAWVKDGFWEEYFDREPSAVSIFETEKDMMVG